MVRAPAPLPTVESLVRCAVSLTYVILLRLCGRRCPANLCEWWESPGVVLDDLRAMMARAHESELCEYSALAGLRSFRTWPTLQTSAFVVQQAWWSVQPQRFGHRCVCAALFVLSRCLLAMSTLLRMYQWLFEKGTAADLCKETAKAYIRRMREKARQWITRPTFCSWTHFSGKTKRMEAAKKFVAGPQDRRIPYKNGPPFSCPTTSRRC